MAMLNNQMVSIYKYHIDPHQKHVPHESHLPKLIRSCGPDGFVDATEGQRLLRRTGLQELQPSSTVNLSWEIPSINGD